MTTQDEKIYPPQSAVSDTDVEPASRWSWRRIIGVVLVSLGALLIAGFAALSIVVALTFVEWRNPFDGLSSIAMVSGVPIIAGAALAALGRWIYGGWRKSAPIAHAASVVLPVIGVIAAFAAIATFFWVLFAETGRGGAWSLGQFVISVLASLALVGVGIALRFRRVQD